MSLGLLRRCIYLKYSLWDWGKLLEEKMYMAEDESCFLVQTCCSVAWGKSCKLSEPQLEALDKPSISGWEKSQSLVGAFQASHTCIHLGLLPSVKGGIFLMECSTIRKSRWGTHTGVWECESTLAGSTFVILRSPGAGGDSARTPGKGRR